jgi:hypothetical protein
MHEISNRTLVNGFGFCLFLLFNDGVPLAWDAGSVVFGNLDVVFVLLISASDSSSWATVTVSAGYNCVIEKFV